jgi:hypothetical protein
VLVSIRQLFRGRYKYCECGCKELIPVLMKNGRFARFKFGHQNRGQNQGNFKGYTIYNDYIYDYSPNHPFHNSSNYVADHRLIYEHYLKILFDQDIYLDPKIYDVHHINKDKKDNRLINLELMTKLDHLKHHNPRKDNSNTVCCICGSTKTYITKNGCEDWYGNEIDGPKCKNCYMKEYNIQVRKIRRRLKRIESGKISTKPYDPTTGRFIKENQSIN